MLTTERPETPKITESCNARYQQPINKRNAFPTRSRVDQDTHNNIKNTTTRNTLTKEQPEQYNPFSKVKMTDVAAATETPNPVTPTEGGQISNNNHNNDTPDNNNNDTESSSLSSTSFPIFDQVKGYLESSELSYQINERRREEVGGGLLDDGNTIIISLTLTGNNSSYKTYIDMKKREQRVAVYVETPVKIPEHKRSEACEYLMRVNYSLALGSFEVDFRDGEVRYRCAIDVEGSALSLPMIRTNIMVSAATTDRFFPGLMAVVFAHKAPQLAYDDCRATLPIPGMGTSAVSNNTTGTTGVATATAATTTDPSEPIATELQ